MSDIFSNDATFTTDDYGRSSDAGAPGRYINDLRYGNCNPTSPVTLYLFSRPIPSADFSNGIDDGIKWPFYKAFKTVPTKHYPDGVKVPGEARFVPIRREAKPYVAKGSLPIQYRESYVDYIDAGDWPAADGSPKVATLVLFNAIEAESGQHRIYALNTILWEQLCEAISNFEDAMVEPWTPSKHPVILAITSKGIAGKLSVKLAKGLPALVEQPPLRPIVDVLKEKHSSAMGFFTEVANGTHVVPGEDDIAAEWADLSPKEEAIKAAEDAALSTSERLSVSEMRTALQTEGVDIPANATRSQLEKLYRAI